MVHGSKAEDVEKDLEGMYVMKNIGRNMAWLLNSIKQNTHPEPGQKPITSFIR